MLFASVVLLAVALSTPTLGSKIPESSVLIQLFAEYQSDPNLVDYHTLEENGSGENFWTGKGTFPKKYSGWDNQKDIKEVIKSFTFCEENNALSLWRYYNVTSVMQSSILNVILENISDEADLVDVKPSELATLKRIIAGRCKRFPYIQNIGWYLLDPPNAFLRPDTITSVAYRKITAGVLANKACLYAIVVSLFKKAEDHERQSFFKDILKYLDHGTRTRFLGYLETVGPELGGPYDVNCWRTCPLFQEIARENADRKETIVSALDLGEDASGISVFDCADISGRVLAHVELYTLLNSVPYVSKLFNTIVTKDLFLQRSSVDLRVRLNAEAEESDPYRMCLQYPWNALFSSSRELVKFHLTTAQLVTNENWLIAALETLPEEGNKIEFGVEGELDYGNEEMLRHCLIDADLSNLLVGGIPISVLAHFFDIIMGSEDLSTLKAFKFSKFSPGTQINLVKHVKKGPNC